MECPHCKADSNVKDSREHEPGVIRRRRVCVNGHRFTTWESTLSPHSALKRLAAQRRQRQAKVERLGPEEMARRQKYYRLRTEARAEAKRMKVSEDVLFARHGVNVSLSEWLSHG